MCSVVVYLHLDSSLYFALCPVFGDGEAAKGRKKVARTMLKHLKKYYVKHHFLKAGTGDCE